VKAQRLFSMDEVMAVRKKRIETPGFLQSTR